LEALHATRSDLKMKLPKYITASDEETKILQNGLDKYRLAEQDGFQLCERS
jgi:hypothetical protein